MSKRLTFTKWKDDHGMSACFPDEDDEDVEDAFHANDEYMDELEAENKKLKELIRHKDLDIEMYQGALVEIKIVTDLKQELKTWQGETK